MSRRKINCECGKTVTTNTLKMHLKSKYCPVNIEKKKYKLSILELKTKHTNAWRVNLGEEALIDPSWFISVLDGRSVIDDWRFSSPRKACVVPPSKAQEYSKKRKGNLNPCTRKKVENTKYNKNDIIIFIKEIIEKYKLDDSLSFGKMKNEIEQKFPFFMYYFEKSKEFNTTILTLFNIVYPKNNKKEIQDILSKRRGLFISKGQRSSPYCISKASETASKMTSSWRVTIPERILFKMIHSVDPSSSTQKRETKDGRWFSFDIYSPKINALIEMHGRIWHDVSAAPLKLKPLAQTNIENDNIKKVLAKEKGLKYVVFWDDQTETWNDKIRSLYGKDATKFEEAKSQIDKKSRKTKSI